MEALKKAFLLVASFFFALALAAFFLVFTLLAALLQIFPAVVISLILLKATEAFT